MKICKGLVKLSFAYTASQTGRKTSLQLRYLDIYLVSNMKAMETRLWWLAANIAVSLKQCGCRALMASPDHLQLQPGRG